MYSLDQVIYFLEQRQQTEDWNIRDAAIAYLKGYREVLPEYAQMKLDAVKNEPLTWDELRTKEGKPVWVEHKHYNKWLIVYEVYENTIVLDGNGSYTQYFSDDNDKEVRWKAYRKERE